MLAHERKKHHIRQKRKQHGHHIEPGEGAFHVQCLLVLYCCIRDTVVLWQAWFKVAWLQDKKEQDIKHVYGYLTFLLLISWEECCNLKVVRKRMTSGLTGKFLLSSLRSCHMLTNRFRFSWSNSRCTDTFLFLLASRRSQSSSTSLKLSTTIARAYRHVVMSYWGITLPNTCSDRDHSHCLSSQDPALGFYFTCAGMHGIFLFTCTNIHKETDTSRHTSLAFLMNCLTRSFMPAALQSEGKKTWIICLTNTGPLDFTSNKKEQKKTVNSSELQQKAQLYIAPKMCTDLQRI